MPAHRQTNQRDKRERLPSAERLNQAHDLIVTWWFSGYVSSPNTIIPDRFVGEAKAALPRLTYTP